MIRIIIVFVALLITLATPFLLRSGNHVGARDTPPENVLTIITPHNETIREEFTTAFTNHMRSKHGRDVYIDWRTPGGTAEVSKMINSLFLYAEKHHEENGGFGDYSRVGIKIDLFFGGGPYDFIQQAKHGHLIPCGIYHRRPEWFSDEIIPSSVSGETFYDVDKRWIGSCLSNFGICYNTDSLKRLGIENPPTQWRDLADPRFFGQIALADPTKSGSANKAFEMLIQQEMRKAVARKNPKTPEEEMAAVSRGWENALQLIQRICANARYFTDSASKIPLDVSQGNAAAGMSIDFYSRTLNEKVKDDTGTSRIQYITPVGGSSTAVDPIAMLRGAPNETLALDFIEFVLSKEGQRIWCFKPKTPGGPKNIALRRLPIRKDLYSDAELTHFSDPEVMPYESADQFVYEPAWTGDHFSTIQEIVKSMCIAPHHEQRAAWKAMKEKNFKKHSVENFENINLVNYSNILQIPRKENRRVKMRRVKDWSDFFRNQYKQAKFRAEIGGSG